LTKRLWFATLTIVATMASGCQSQSQAKPGDYVLPAGGSWSEQREQAESILVRYAEEANQSGHSTTEPSLDSSHMILGPAILSAVVDPGGSRMTVTFTGARSRATEPCGIDYSAEAVESAKAIVIIILQQRHAYGEDCTLEGTDRTAVVNLARPLANRAVLDLQQPEPVPVSTAPAAR
jgi:hypothetical protein